jgi:hypothetical protein
MPETSHILLKKMSHKSSYTKSNRFSMYSRQNVVFKSLNASNFFKLFPSIMENTIFLSFRWFWKILAAPNTCTQLVNVTLRFNLFSPFQPVTKKPFFFITSSRISDNHLSSFKFCFKYLLWSFFFRSQPFYLPSC